MGFGFREYTIWLRDEAEKEARSEEKMKKEKPKPEPHVVSINGHVIDLLRVDYVSPITEPGGAARDGFFISSGGPIIPVFGTEVQRQKLIERLGWSEAEEL